MTLASLAIGRAAGQVAEAPPDGRVTVEVASGRRFAGEVDAGTDESTLWIRHNLTSGHVLRPIDWSRVVGVELDGESYSGEQFREAVGIVRQALGSDLNESGDPSGDSRPATFILGPAQSPPQFPPADPARAVDVRSLSIDAALANWDADVEPDGLILDVLPLDLEGTPVPVHGSIEVDLMAERVGVVRRPDPFARIGRWTRRVEPADFGVYGARYRLPFQAIDPDFDLRWASHGALHVRLAVPGGGVFEQTDSTLRIRPYSSVRDRLEQTTGHRYFYLERTGTGKR